MRGRNRSDGIVPADASQQVKLALEGFRSVVEAAGLKMANVVFVNPYLTSAIPMNVMNELYAGQFEFGNTPARATILVASLPQESQIEFTGVAVRDPSQRRAIRPRNMPPSATASPCVFAGDTLYCSAKSGFIPGVNGGIFAATVEHQLRQTMRNLLDNLEEAGMDFSNVVAANVYLDDLRRFRCDEQDLCEVFQRDIAGPNDDPAIGARKAGPGRGRCLPHPRTDFRDRRQVRRVALTRAAGIIRVRCV